MIFCLQKALANTIVVDKCQGQHLGFEGRRLRGAQGAEKQYADGAERVRSVEGVLPP